MQQALVAVLLAAVVVVCLRLGWWQLQRFTSGTGSWQNLGYTFQWPTFAVFAIVVWWRLRALHSARERPAPQTETPDPEPPRSVWAAPAPGRRAADDEPDAELAAYNSYLAGLGARQDATGPNDQEPTRGR